MKRLILVFFLYTTLFTSATFCTDVNAVSNEAELINSSPTQTISNFTHLMFSGTGKGADAKDLAKALNFIEPPADQLKGEKKSISLKKIRDLFFLLQSVNYTTDNIRTISDNGKNAIIELGEPEESIRLELVHTKKNGWIFSNTIFTKKEYTEAFDHLDNVKANIEEHADDFVLEYSSPLNTLYTFLYGVQNIHGYTLTDSVGAIDLSKIDKNIIDELGPTWAIQLYRILSYASPIEPESLSNDPLFTGNIILLLDSNLGMINMKVVKDAETEKNSWKIDLSGVKNVSNIYDLFMHQGMSKELGTMGVKHVPLHVKIDDFFQVYIPVLEKTFLSFNIWKWVLIILLILSCVLIIPLVRMICRPVIHQIIKSLHLDLNTDADQRFILPLQISAVTLYLLRGIVIITANPAVMTIAIVTMKIVMCLTILLFICRFIDSSCAVVSNHFDTNLHIITSVAGKVLQVMAVIAAALYLCNVFSINTKNFLAALGIGGFAFALAGKDTLENFLGSVMVIVDRPFKNGDVIKIKDIEGEIIQVGVRSTRIRTFNDSVITIPNRMFISSPVENRAVRRWRRYNTTFDILYDTKPTLIEEFTSGISELVRLHPDSRKDKIEVYFYSLGQSSLQVYINIFFQNRGRVEELKARQEINSQALELAKYLGIEFAYPTQTLHIDQLEPSVIESPNILEEQPKSTGLSEGILIARKLSKHYDPDNNV